MNLDIIEACDEKENSLDRLHRLPETFKLIYGPNADKVATIRAELGLPNPFSEFKPYSVSSE